MNTGNTSSKDKYFASEDPAELAKQVLNKVDAYDRYLSASGRLNLYRQTYKLYNSGALNGASVSTVGEQGEYKRLEINHFRNLLTHILQLTTNQRPAFDARASTNDYKSLAQTKVANNILDYYTRSKGLENYTKQAVEDVLVFADAFVYQGWDFSLGDPYMVDPETQKMIKQGDVLHKNYTPLDVIIDFTAGFHDSESEWVILRDWQNKWNLVERYPELKDKLIQLEGSYRHSINAFNSNFGYDSDYVPVYIFIHRRTDALPDGRFFTCVANDTYLIDAPLPEFYQDFPVYHIRGSKQTGTSFGYTVAFDLAAEQEAINVLYSTVLTNQSSFGVQSIVLPKGSSLSPVEIMDGLNAIYYDPQFPKPESLNLTNTPPEIFNFIATLESRMETISGINSVARGNPEPSLKSGSALALVQSMAIQFNSGLQQSYTNLLEKLGLGLINILKANAQTPRMIEISGVNNASYAKEFTSKDISNVNRVIVDVGNPLSKTTAGKVNMADNLLTAGLIKNPAEYIQVLTTGRLEPLIEGQQAELMLIKSENEQLSEGKPVIAVRTDNHSIHVIEHKSVLASPMSRENAEAVTNTMNHILEHINLWKSADPALLMLLKEPPPPVVPAQVPQPQAVGDLKGNSETLSSVPPVVEKAREVRMPSMPKMPTI